MSSMRIKLLASFLLISILLGCDSEQETTPAPIPEPEKTFNFSFRYDTQSEEANDFELILSNTDGKVLLDTLIAFNTNHSLRLKSGDTKYNLTTVIFDPVIDTYWIKTYIKVNPDKWNLQYYMISTEPVEEEMADITYINFPNTDFYFRTKAITNYSGGFSGSLFDNTLTLTGYDKLLPSDLAYIVVPAQGKYMLTEVTSKQTTVNFTEAGNTVKRKYNRPADITNFRTFVYGFTKEGDPKSRIELYSPIIKESEEYDLQFPPTGFEAFNLRMFYNDAAGYEHTYTYNVKEIPSEVELSPTSDFSVSKSGFEDFMIAFTNDKPSIYNVNWAADDPNYYMRWSIFNSPDETSFKPKAFLEGLKSKKLEGKNMSLFKLFSVSSRKDKDSNYQDILNFSADPSRSFYSEVKQDRVIVKHF
ncbi:hypothetical protein [Pontibacter sp. H249]|uniref:hypothetical protein n=1 Tax=Pontibacter sp. H249 TaxID=3133420 RepID=UPI0030BB151E